MDVQMTARQLIEAIRGTDADARWSAAENAAGAGAEAIPELAQVMDGNDPEKAKAARVAMDRIALASTAPGDEERRRQVSEALAAVARGDGALAARRHAVRLLGLAGGEEACDTLAALIGQKDLREDARMALQRIPGKAADRTLERAARNAPAGYESALRRSLQDRKVTRRDAGIR
ncbi:MAG: hypothetical protein KatS3mg024_1177 [Armatimonadota bacterium]|nr:MAG: hypothetical protein KatS3mg024_1177 [Armatimonadota bacterium]